MTKLIVPVTRADPQQAAADDNLVFLVDPSVKERSRELKIVAISRIAIGLVFLLSWELASGRVVDPFWVSSPSLIWAALIDLSASGLLFKSIVSTVSVAISGFIAGTVVGMVVGMIFGTVRIVAKSLDPYLVAFYSIPRIALIPLFILWFGIGLETKIIYTGLLVFFPVFMNTLSGVRDVDSNLIDDLRVMGASRLDVLRKVLFPSVLAWLFAGLKISAPYALTGAVVAEMFSSSTGLGYLISYNANTLNTAGLFATLLVITALGLLLTMLVAQAENHVLRWKPAGSLNA
jgi:NitT/TauT family transport system permease protein